MLWEEDDFLVIDPPSKDKNDSYKNLLDLKKKRSS